MFNSFISLSIINNNNKPLELCIYGEWVNREGCACYRSLVEIPYRC